MKFSDYLSYVDGKLIWIISHGKTNRKIGDVAGCISGDNGYSIVRFGGRNYLAHRIIWEIHNGEIPKGMQIDHINHVRDDNRIENLRLVKGRENQRNMSTRKDSSSGVTGVRFRSDRGKWIARIKVDGKNISLGSFGTKDEAVRARNEANIYYGFHENHGR